jgi:hypothetical protein
MVAMLTKAPVFSDTIACSIVDGNLRQSKTLLGLETRPKCFPSMAQQLVVGHSLLIIEDSQSQFRHTTLGRTPLDE